MQTHAGISRVSGRTSGHGFRLQAAAIALVALLAAHEHAGAQPVPIGILAPGDSAVTGFSGAIAPLQVRPGVDPRERTFIDLNGPSLRIIDLGTMPGAPEAQYVNAPKPYTFLASQVGQVFAVALDNAVPPNIYVAATSSYGLPIVVQAADGQLRHVKTGAPGAGFMPGLWGGAAPTGGPGSIWKIEGVNGAVSLFANVTLNGRQNSGPALGGLVFDPASNMLFAADRETGLIHRFDMTGVERGRYDHGVQGRPAMGLPPVALDPDRRLDITNPAYDSERSATWNYAVPERRVFGLGIRSGRLYYSVADGLQIWSISLANPNVLDPVLEFSIPPSGGATEISKIEFDQQGRMILGERPEPTGAFDFNALTQEGVGRVLRYGIYEKFPGVPRMWQPEPSDYAVGFPLNMTNGNGGVAIGLDYDRLGAVDPWSCGGFLWSTGERLRVSADPALAARLQQGGPLNVHGLQGNRLWMVRPQNTPPLQSYFIDHDERFNDETARGHMGDIAIWRVCGPVLRGGWMLPWWTAWWSDVPGPLSPPFDLACPPAQHKPAYQCCPKGTTPIGGQCKPYCPNGLMDPKSQKICGLGFDNASYDPNDLNKLKCIGGSAPNKAKGVLGCIDKSPVFNPPVCQAGWSKQQVGNNTVCQPTKEQLQCPVGQQVSNIDKQCHPLCLSGTAWPGKQCCAPGSKVTGSGQCCPFGSIVDPKTGKCAKEIVFKLCPQGAVPDPETGQCPPGPPASSCPPGSNPDGAGNCKKTVSSCLPGLSPDPATGECKPTPPKLASCAAAQLGKDGTCCPAGASPNNIGGGCCPKGQSASANGTCQAMACPAPGKQVAGKCCSPNDLKPGGACAALACASGKVPTGASNACCDASKVYTDKNGAQACCAGTMSGGQCTLGGQAALPGCSPGSADPKCCPAGYKQAGGSCCLASQVTSSGQCCAGGQTPSGPNKSQCGPTMTGTPPDGGGTATPPGGGGSFSGGQCCMTGTIPAASGVCCAPAQITSMGMCCPAGQTPDPKNRKACVACGERQTAVNGACCANANIYKDKSGAPQCCPQVVDPQKGVCAPLINVNVIPACATGYTPMPDGSCCVSTQVSSDGKHCGIPIQSQQQPSVPPYVPPSQQQVRPAPPPSVPPSQQQVRPTPPPSVPPPSQQQVRPTPPPSVPPPSQQQVRPAPPPSVPPLQQQLRPTPYIPPPQVNVRPPQQYMPPPVQTRPPVQQLQVRPPTQPQFQGRPSFQLRRCLTVRGQTACQSEQ